MVWISSKSISYLRCSFLFTIAFYLVKDPSVLTEQPFIIVLGQAMHLKHGALNTKINNNNFIASIFAILGLIDFLPLLNGTSIYFDTIPIVRLLITFITMGISLFFPDSALSYDVIFTLTLFEIWINFWLHNTIKQEQEEKAIKLSEMLANANEAEILEKIEHLE